MDENRVQAGVIARFRGAAATAAVVLASVVLAPQATAATPAATEFSAGISSGSLPRGIAAGPDGNLWFAEFDGNRIGRITPSGTVTEFSSGISAGAKPIGIVTGPDGNLWFSEIGAAKIGRMTPAGAVTEFGAAAGIPADAGPLGIDAGPDGNLWYADPNRNSIGRITSSGTFTEFTAGISAGAEPVDIVPGPDGNLWFTENGRDRIGRISTSGGVTEFVNGIGANAGPAGITPGPDGNLWFAEELGDRIGRITPSGQVTEFSAGITPGSRPSEIVAGPDGNLWFTEIRAGRIGRITPSGDVTEFSAGISPGSMPSAITAGPDGNLWFTERTTGRIGRINTAQDPPAFRNATPIQLPAGSTSVGPASPYPSPVEVSGLEGTVTDVDVRLVGLSHSFARDLDLLLVGPDGQTAQIVSDVQASSPEPHGISWTIDDEGAGQLPSTNAPLVSGIFRPADFTDPNADTFPAPAPAGPYGSALSAFDGSSPNGTWRLFAQDDANGDVGALHGGWGLDIQTTGPPAADPPPEGDGGTQPDGDPPETEIDKRPKKKTPKSKATFEFSADEPGSGFECALSGKGVKKPLKRFKPCDDGDAAYKKLRDGKKAFGVRAIDAAGNVDPTPATAKWKVL